MRILFMNQYGVGDDSPTARLMIELAAELRLAGNEVRVIAADFYGARAAGWRRWCNELKAHFQLFFQACMGPRPDVIISLTSPACLLLTAGLVAKIRGARSIHWAMDLYPDIALALGEIRPGPMFTFLQFLMKAAYAGCAAVVVLDEDMRKFLMKGYGVEAEVIPLWPSREYLDAMEACRNVPSEKWSWLYSGNLGRAHDWETLLSTQKILEARNLPIWLFIQGDGYGYRKAQAWVENQSLRQCVFRKYAPADEVVSSLLQSNALVATRKPETVGLLWPSKLVLLQILDRPLAWVDDLESSISLSLRNKPNAGVFAPGQSEALANWLENCFCSPSEKEAVPSGGRELRAKLFQEWKELLDRG